MTINDNLDDLLSEIFKNTSKPFNEVFKIENTKIGLKITALLPVEVDGMKFQAFDSKLNANISINKTSITDLQDKHLIGILHTQGGHFIISDFSDTPQED